MWTAAHSFNRNLTSWTSLKCRLVHQFLKHSNLVAHWDIFLLRGLESVRLASEPFVKFDLAIKTLFYQANRARSLRLDFG